MLRVDLNSDLGELEDGGALDAAMIPLITSANIACGFHAGGPVQMAAAVAAARRAGTAVGAHPSFPDRANFGRSKMALPAEQVRSETVYQLGALSALCRAEGMRMSHVKPHGALYNMAAGDIFLARAVCEGIMAVDPSLILVGLSGSELIAAAKECGLRSASEVFADRAYMADGSLAPRGQAGAVLSDLDEIVERTVRMIAEGHVASVDGGDIAIRADTVCLHGDNPGAVDFARAIRAALNAAGIEITPLEELVR